MKTFWNILAALILSGAMIYTAKTCKRVPDGVIVTQKWIDSVNAIANSKPTTIIKTDTIKPDTVVKWRDHYVYVPVMVDSNRYSVNDSLVNKELTIYISDTTKYKDYLLSRKIGYRLNVPLRITDSIFITKQVPVLIPEPQKKFYLEGGLGISDRFLFSIEGGVLKGNRNYGIEYERFGKQDIIKIKTGIKF